MPLKIYTSNRMENLVQALSGILKEPLSSPFEPEVIVVQSKGMQRWVAMELARRFGIWANCVYPFPNSMVWRLFRAVLPEVPDISFFSPDIMAWKIMGLLPGFLDKEEFGPLANYLAGDSAGLKSFQLSERIADTFDQYTLFRPDMLLEWEERGGEDWQGTLWREMASSGNGRHRGRLREEFLKHVVAGAPTPRPIPERVSIFGVSYLPQYHMDVLAAAARMTDINLFLLSPSREYWADIIPAKKLARLSSAQRDLRIEGNPLLASLGRLGRDFSDMVIDLGEVASGQEDLYTDQGRDSLLKAIQSDILNLRGAGEEKEPIRSGDISIQIHSCHSPMREIEVIHDNLLALFETLDSLEPRDIVVMTPDIETYAPYISTVFGGCRDPLRNIPFSIADRNLTCEGRIASLLLKVFGLAGSRLSVPQVLDVLNAAPVARRFALDEEELETIRGWLEKTRVRWGMDERDRERLGLPAYSENSWRAGLDRLLLGYALPEEGGTLFNGKLPYDEIEGAAAVTLGKLVSFINRVADAADALGRSRTLSEWRDQLRKVLEDFIEADDDTARELSAVVGVVDALGELEEQAGYRSQVEPGVIRSWLTGRLAKEEKGYGFMTGGVTFCAMLPMRSIPFRVVALIGMNDGAFPRQSRPPGFDLIARHPRRGDRSLRDEDRFLFLESILSARDCLYLSYVGQSIRDNSEIPPSVLVSELLDAVARGFAPEDGRTPEERLVTKHRLQAFSSGYFSADSRLFSYSEENCEALREKCAGTWQPAEFLTIPLASPPDEWKDIPLPKLLRFFRNPAQFFLENRLGIRLEEIASPLDDREPFAVDGLEAYGLKQQLLEIFLDGGDPEKFLPVACCRGILPPARHGELVFADAAGDASGFAESVRERIAGRARLEPLDFELELNGFRLTGRLERIWPDGMIRYRCATMKAKDQISAWIEHLVLNAIDRDGYPRETVLLMTDGCKTFAPVENAAEILGNLFDLYRQGLMAPLRFFPDSAMAYAKDREWNLERARQRWEPGFLGKGEGDEPHFRLCFGDSNPFNAEFEKVSRILLEPMLLHQN